MLAPGTASRKSVQAETVTDDVTSTAHLPQIRDAKSPIDTASRSPVTDKAKEWPSGHGRVPPGERTAQSAASESGTSQPLASTVFSMSSSNAASQMWNRSGWTWTTRWDQVEQAISIMSSNACQSPVVLCIPSPSTRISSSGSETGISINVGSEPAEGAIGSHPYREEKIGLR